MLLMFLGCSKKEERDQNLPAGAGEEGVKSDRKQEKGPTLHLFDQQRIEWRALAKESTKQDLDKKD